MDDDAPVLTAKQCPAVTEITLNCPERRNALSTGLLESLCQALAAAEADPSQRVLILRGNGSAFCAGLDLHEAQQPKQAEQAAQWVAQALKALYQSRLVSIAAVHGTAAAGGAGLMSACDFVIAAEDAWIGYPEVHRGLVAALVMGLLYRQVGERCARELTLLGEFITGEEAQEMGLVNRAVPGDQLQARVETWAQLVLRGGPTALARTKQVIAELGPHPFEDDLHRALQHHLTVRRSPEAGEGLAAFVEKRTPQWPQAPDSDRGVGSS